MTAAALVAACGDDGGSATGGSSTSATTTATTSTTAGTTTDMMTTGLVCTAPEVDCGGVCVDTGNSVEHCGGCDMPCGANEVCTMGMCECAVMCDGDCVDPMTNPMFCGASGDCMGPNAGEACGPAGVCEMGACADSCVNCSFETGDFTGWTTVDLASAFFPLQVDVAGIEVANGAFGFFASEPTDGMFAAVHGFDGTAGTISVGQDITINAGLTTASLEFDYRGAWEVRVFKGATMDKTFSVNVEPAGGGTPLQTDLILTAPVGDITPDTGPLTGTVDLSAYVGMTVFINFAWDLPRTSVGPAFFQLDNVRVTGT